jgi:hypothetical protein
LYEVLEVAVVVVVEANLSHCQRNDGSSGRETETEANPVREQRQRLALRDQRLSLQRATEWAT